jgi:predicted DNA-binding transcriptional regulator AlpA
LTPRGLSRAQAAEYVGVSPNTFDQMVSEGTLPSAIDLPSHRRKIWDKLALDAVLNRLGGYDAAEAHHTPTPFTVDSPNEWDEVLQ